MGHTQWCSRLNFWFCTQESFLEGPGGSYGVLGFKTESSSCKASTLLIVLSSPRLGYSLQRSIHCCGKGRLVLKRGNYWFSGTMCSAKNWLNWVSSMQANYHTSCTIFLAPSALCTFYLVFTFCLYCPQSRETSFL